MKLALTIFLIMICLIGCSPAPHREYTDAEKQELVRNHALHCKRHGQAYIIELLEKIDRKLPDREGVQ